MNSRALSDITNTNHGTYKVLQGDRTAFPVRKSLPHKINSREEKNASMVEVPVHFAPYSQPNLLPASQLMGTRNVVIANKEENKGEKSITRGRWTEEEDNILRSIIEKIGNTNDWHKIANKMPRRNAKQCKERWANYLDPSINRGEWTEEEDRIIIEGVKEHGKCWGKISTKLKGRPNNAIKNRFNTVIRKKFKNIEKTNVNNTEIKNEVKETKIRTILPKIQPPILPLNVNHVTQNMISDSLIYTSVNQTMLPFYKEMDNSYNQYINYNPMYSSNYQPNTTAHSYHTNPVTSPSLHSFNSKYDINSYTATEKVSNIYNTNYIPNDFVFNDQNSFSSETASLKSNIANFNENSDDITEISCSEDQKLSLFCEEKVDFLEQDNYMQYLDLEDENVQKVIDSLKDYIELDKYQTSTEPDSSVNQLEEFSLMNFYESQM